MPKVTLMFNAKAVDAMSAKAKPTKMRIDSTWQKADGLRLRPTNRKAGPHMMPSLTFRAKGATLELDEAILEKMIEDGMPADFFQTGERLSVVSALYDWVVLMHGTDHEKFVGTATVTVK